jgi:3-oxoacyl-[acyl-carrier protein] reductase
MRLEGKVAIISGAASGMGAATARRFGREGAKVVVADVLEDEGRKVAADITRANGTADFMRLDVTSENDWKTVVDATVQKYGKLDVLVNNAGVYEFAPIDDFTEEQFRRLFDTNVLGVLLASREAAKYFDGEGGSIINVGSAVTQVTPPASSVYTGTKAAVDAITRVLAKELGPKKIRVNSINPGMVETEGVHAAGFIGSDFQKQAVAQTPLGRIGQPDDIAPVAVFLASQDSGWLTGELVTAAGGMR